MAMTGIILEEDVRITAMIIRNQISTLIRERQQHLSQHQTTDSQQEPQQVQIPVGLPVVESADSQLVNPSDTNERDPVHKNTFTKWVNKHLEKASKHVEDLFEDLRDGHNLISLLEVLSGELLPREQGRMRYHMLENVQIALDFLRYRKIKLVNIRAEDIVDGNPKLTFGLIWTIILHFQTVNKMKEEIQRFSAAMSSFKLAFEQEKPLAEVAFAQIDNNLNRFKMINENLPVVTEQRLATLENELASFNQSTKEETKEIVTIVIEFGTDTEQSDKLQNNIQTIDHNVTSHSKTVVQNAEKFHSALETAVNTYNGSRTEQWQDRKASFDKMSETVQAASEEHATAMEEHSVQCAEHAAGQKSVIGVAKAGMTQLQYSIGKSIHAQDKMIDKFLRVQLKQDVPTGKSVVTIGSYDGETPKQRDYPYSRPHTKQSWNDSDNLRKKKLCRNSLFPICLLRNKKTKSRPVVNRPKITVFRLNVQPAGPAKSSGHRTIRHKSFRLWMEVIIFSFDF